METWTTPKWLLSWGEEKITTHSSATAAMSDRLGRHLVWLLALPTNKNLSGKGRKSTLKINATAALIEGWGQAYGLIIGPTYHWKPLRGQQSESTLQFGMMAAQAERLNYSPVVAPDSFLNSTRTKSCLVCPWLQANTATTLGCTQPTRRHPWSSWFWWTVDMMLQDPTGPLLHKATPFQDQRLSLLF